MSTNIQPFKSRRYVAIFILAVACIVGIGLSKGWFGLGDREVETDGASTDISQSSDHIDVPPLVTAQDAAASKNK